jgi:putative transposase
MPRGARLDVPGFLQHVIVRGIEKRDIFYDDQDRQSFVRRFSKLLQEIGTECLAWALLPNHAHLLLRPKRTKLAVFMRRLLTGYAVTFNLRHERSGHLFHNRYKSIVCEEEPYLLELVRYIHLNPLRAGMVNDMNELDYYTWSGHAVLMGNQEMPGQRIDEVLARFGQRIEASRRQYREFVIDGIARGKRDELVGGGLCRALQLTDYEQAEPYDERVLGSGEFVERLTKENELSGRLSPFLPLPVLIERISGLVGIKPETLRQRNRAKRISDARGIISYIAVREMEHHGAEVASMLNMSPSAVSIAAARGEEILRRNQSLRNEIDNLIT